MNESEPLTLLPNGLPQPPIPQRLMERLRGYPDHIRRLQEELNHKIEGSRAARGTTSHIFEQLIWPLEGCLDAFIREAKAELGGSVRERRRASNRQCRCEVPPNDKSTF